MSGLLNSLKNLAGSSKPSAGEGDMRFSVSPRGGACGWAEWLKAMRLVARLPTGIPPEFRKKLWLTLAEKHLKVKGVDWTKAEGTCFSEWTNPDDTELGVQIVKDLHRTGCSLFCGTEGRENQAVLKRVLLAYARWNKAVGYCQGFNMLAALILEVMDRSESDSLKVMIYLIEAVLPEGYFANNLRGLSVDMAVFRDLLKLRLPKLSAHLEKLQKGAAEGSCYEPPLTNVFTMQWFLTLFCNCLPRTTVLRVWDLVFLDGDEVLLTTALAIWDTLQDRILAVESADEFYSVMGELARQTLEAPPATSEALLVRAAQLGPVPELPRLRDKHRYNITPWAHSVQSAAKKGLRLFYSEDETDSSDEGDKLAITTAYGFQAAGRGRSALVAAGVFGHPDRERLALDISALKQQYARLRERQRQAHIILAAACARQPSVTSSGPGPISVNHLLLGKSAIVSARGRRLGPPQGAIPPSRTPKVPKNATKPQTKNDTLSWKDENHKKTLSRRDSIKWKDIKQPLAPEEEDDPDEDGKPVSENEINEIMQSSLRTRRKSESSSYSECSESSTSTSLCDEPNRMSDFDSEPASLSDNPVGAIDENIKEEPPAEENLESKDDVDDSNVPKVKEKNDTEFENYIQEFEELLDRTNNIETEIVISPGSISDKNIQLSPSTDILSDDKIVNNDIEPNNTFVEFVDSNRGEPLRNYLDEFRKADDAIKQVRSWDNVDGDQINIDDDINPSIDGADNPIKPIDEDSISIDDRDSLPEIQKYWENSDELNSKPFVYPDYRSNSCERSLSSSISSVSPVLKSTSGIAEDSQSFLCFKSPTRIDSDVGSELSEDEKPIVLKIDKYFEHSPEFFSARKSGSYISSDEEDDSYAAKTKQILSSRLPQYTDNLIVRSDTKIELPESYKYQFLNKDQSDDVCIDCDDEKKPASPINYDSYILSDDNSKKIGYFVPSSSNETNIVKKKLTILSPETIESSFNRESSLQMIEKSEEPMRFSILEKTKSEELPSDQKRSFSILDDEIEAIRSQSGRRNSERALRIIQENSKILHRILINQVNKTSLSFQEEDVNDVTDESNQRERDRKELRLFEYRSHKPLISPRSASLDESLQRKAKNLSVFSDQFPYELELTPLKNLSINSPATSEHKESPVELPTPNYEKKIVKDASESDVVAVEENKTDMFGWENKGFNANQRLASYTSDISPEVGDSKRFSIKCKDELNPVSPSPEAEMNSTLTAVSDTIVEPTDYSVQDYTESWKIENNNSMSESYNLSSPYKFTFKSTENSSYIDGALKSIHKFNESPLPRQSDTLSKVTEYSPLENNARLEGLRFETSQSSDMCIVSSSMSFSFDPSNDDQPSSKPTTFNSSDTLCQLTSLDQVSTPISPKLTTYPLIKDSTGISQRELSLELDKFKLTSDESYTQCSLTDLESGGVSSLKTPSPTSTHDKSRSMKSPEKIYNPFPLRTSTRQPKELTLRLGLYKDPLKSPSK